MLKAVETWFPGERAEMLERTYAVPTDTPGTAGGAAPMEEEAAPTLSRRDPGSRKRITAQAALPPAACGHRDARWRRF